jgi:hypothetical protein
MFRSKNSTKSSKAVLLECSKIQKIEHSDRLPIGNKLMTDRHISLPRKSYKVRLSGSSIIFAKVCRKAAKSAP